MAGFASHHIIMAKIKIICGDAIEAMKTLESGSVDLIVTSPPYNMRSSKSCTNRYKNGKWRNSKILDVGYEGSSDDLTEEEYAQWQIECLTEMFRLINDSGAIFYNHKWRIQNLKLLDRHNIVENFPVRQVIIWQRSGGVNFNHRYFLPTYEVIYMIAKKDFMLVPKANALGDVWKICQDSNNSHPAPFPPEIPDRIIRSTNAKTVLDPFMGSGTTALACIARARDFIGIEKSKEYCIMAQNRIKKFMEDRK